MFKSYSERKKKSVRPPLKILFFLIPVVIIIYMFHLDSQKFKKAYQKIELEQQEFLENFDVYVFESGYMKKRSGVQEIYVPSLAVRVTNLSEKEYSNLMFTANFSREGQSFCRGSATVSRLKSMESKDVYLRCVESAVFGSVVIGLSLMDVFGKVQYFVTLSHDKKRMIVVEAELDFNVLIP